DYGLILLDLTLPDGNGIALLRALRSAGNTAAVVITSARDQIAQRIEGLNAGADDYLVKPFDLSELSARVAAVARRYHGQAGSIRHFGDVAIDFVNRAITRAGENVELTAREWAVLERLTQTENAIVSKADIEDSLYAFGAEVESNAVEVYVSRLRKKLGKDVFKTTRGVGYQVRAGAK
ncbi:MAG: response regulator transcription factor, partial [Deltaproteobacteria bacterium]